MFHVDFYIRVEPVIAINRFPDDTEDDLRLVREYFQSIPVECAVSEVVRHGGRGGVTLAEKVLKVIAEKPANFRYFYDLSASPEEKIRKLAVEFYGASDVAYTEEAQKDLERIHKLKLDNLPINMAKTPYSFSDDPDLKGAPSHWNLTVRAVRPYTGAGFLVALAGKMMLMPGLPARPMLEDMDLADDGRAKGLF
ncbi:MAG: formate--tetrahydrofolate ligase [Candidatus Omnitrophica bacterium]|nr:formate--tetrahydrofolate ligase [Candidatus Omnitrophota bacterium]